MNEPSVNPGTNPPNFPAPNSLPPTALSVADLGAYFAKEAARDNGSPLARLYYKSLQSLENHFEGAACIPALHRVAEELRGQGHPRADFGARDERFAFMREYARRIFDRITDVKAYVNDFHPEQGKFDVPVLAVVFFGSYVRGKPEPGDLDARIVIPYGEARFVDTFMMGFNEAQSAVSWAWQNSNDLPKSVRVGEKDIRIALEVDSHYGEGGGLEFVEKCPYLVFVKDENGGEPLMFMNTGGKDYLKGRAP